MAEGGAAGEALDDRFKRIYDHLKDIVAELDVIKRDHLRIMSGSDLTMLVIVNGEETQLDVDLHRLQRQLRAHG